MKKIILPILIWSSFSFAHNVKIEVGETDIHSNFFQVPKSGTRVSFPEDRQQTSARLYANWNLNETDSFRILYAPFVAKTTLQPTAAIDFKGSTFAAGTPVDVTYQFNSYRLSYIRTWGAAAVLSPHIGFTAKIRDAEIKLSNGSVSQKRANIGFVPLLNVGVDYNFASDWKFSFDVDAAAASQGRAIDGAIEVNYRFRPQYQAGLGYRVLDGGVNTDSNLNFAQLRTVYLMVSTEIF